METSEPGDDIQWLTYWTVYSAFSVAEYWLDIFISFIPFYYEAKILFLVWLQLPQTNGATFVYHQYMKPFLKKHESRIDKELQDAQRKAGQIAARGVEKAKDAVTSVNLLARLFTT